LDRKEERVMETKRNGERGRILLAEDDTHDRRVAQSLLELAGYRVIEVSDGREALEHLKKQPFDVLITDLDVGGYDGLVLTAQAREAIPDIQVIVVTGEGSKETVIAALRYGVFDYVEKPVDPDRLLVTVSRAVEKGLMLRELVRLARTDGLTGLYNQRYFHEILDREVRRCRRQDRPLTLVLVDVDSFKGFNDRHGHLAGDECLVRIATCLREACRRDIDMVFRYGGDEFVIVLPEAGHDIAREVCERVRERVQALGADGISVSLGVAGLEEEEDARVFIRHADEAMYLAKQLGGDRSVVFGPVH
jgi:diguanylate cyclase (GGDEF)-like protein